MTKMVIGILVSVLMVSAANTVYAQTIPNVRGLTPFTAQTSFMSLAGYLRWQYSQENSAWITRAEAARLVQSQTKATPKK